MATPIWHGNKAESDDLLAAVTHYCECVCDQAAGKIVTPCAGHAMMVTDQRALDGFLFARYLSERLWNEEFMVADASAVPANA